jgi:hypothetical protein
MGTHWQGVAGKEKMHSPGTVATRPERMTIRIGLLMLAGMVLSACAPQGTYGPLAGMTPVYPPAAFAHRVSTPDVDIYWNCSQPEPGLLRLNGVAKNSGGREVRFLKLELVSMNAKDQNLLQAAAAVPDIVLYTNQQSPFQLDLPTTGAEARYDLFYEYSLGVRLSTQDIRFMARDVCSESQHRVTNMGG